MTVTHVGEVFPVRLSVPPEPVAELSVAQYHAMLRAGVLEQSAPIELLDGWLVKKMTKDPPHALAVGCAHDVIQRLLSARCHVRLESPITLARSEPEPDLAIVRGARRGFADRHPGPDDLAVVVEVSDASLERDRAWKKQIYAAAQIPAYWIVNLRERHLEVYSEPESAGDDSDYSRRTVYGAKDSVTLVMDEQELGAVRVAELLP